MKSAHVLRGFSLIELMVGMTIGLLILSAISAVYISSRTTARTNDAIARMQERGRLALDMLATHVSHAGYYGMTTLPDSIIGRAGASGTLTEAALNDCDTDWYLDLETPLSATDGVNAYSGTCMPDITDTREWLASTDTLTVRNAGTDDLDPYPAAPDPTDFDSGQLYVRGDLAQGQLFLGGNTVPDESRFAPEMEIHEINSYIYYVANYDPNAGGEFVPTLMRAETRRFNGATRIENHEIMRNIENLQVEIGLDTNGDADADRFVSPAAGTSFSQAVAVRVWILVTAEEADSSFNPQGNAISYTVGPQTVTYTDSIRRLPMTRTIRLRNINQVRP